MSILRRSVLGLAIVLFTLPAFAGSSGFWYQGIFTKKVPTVEKRFGKRIRDSFRWMEDRRDPAVDAWVAQQKELTAQTLSKPVADFTQSIPAAKARRKIQVLGSASVTPPPPAGPSPLDHPEYEIQYQDVPEVGTGYGALSRILIQDLKTKAVKDILTGFEMIPIRWLSKDVLALVDYEDARTGGSSGRMRIKAHTLGSNPADDRILYNPPTGTWTEVFSWNGKDYVFDMNLTDARPSYGLKTFQIDLQTGTISNPQDLGWSRTPLGYYEGSGNDAYAYFVNFQGHNYGSIEELNLVTQKRVTLFSPTPVGPQEFGMNFLDIRRLGGGRYLVAGQEDTVGFLAVLENGKLQRIPGIAPGTIRILDVSPTEATFLVHSNSGVVEKIFVDLNQKTVRVFERSEPAVKFVTRKIHYQSSLGRPAAIWITHREDVTLSAKTPMIFYGYGAFSGTLLPAADMKNNSAWLEKGGAFAAVTVPGDYTYGIRWKTDARVAGRVHSFDSLALAVKEVIRLGYTSSAKVGLLGASAGGLLVAGAMQRHPELFRAVVSMAGALDMLNCTEPSTGWELGSPCEKSDFRGLYKIAPYHQMKKGNYPAFMAVLGDSDGVVRPFVSYKFVARLQSLQQDASRPVLLHVKKYGGHSDTSGSPQEVLKYMATVYGFFAKELGL
ncbi:MAG: prolyl oligopeptidase family serine peptidase [Bdellovibrionales bacterium]|nr:prolyl oligopeptidase family serine peptidase [Bdellovibrionales bacterium]